MSLDQVEKGFSSLRLKEQVESHWREHPKNINHELIVQNRTIGDQSIWQMLVELGKCSPSIHPVLRMS